MSYAFRCYELHLTIEIIIGPSTPYQLFLPWFLLWVSSLCCVHHPTPGDKLFVFCCWLLVAGQSLSIRSILCSPISQQIPSRPAASLYIARVLSCASVLRSAFRHSDMLQFDMVQKQSCVVPAVKEVVIWIHNISIYETLCSRWVLHIV